MTKEEKDKIARNAASIWCRCFKCDGIINTTHLTCNKETSITCHKWYDGYRTALIALDDKRLQHSLPSNLDEAAKEYFKSEKNNMTQEEKQLLLKDICARLPYGIIIKVSYKDEIFDAYINSISTNGLVETNALDEDWVSPYVIYKITDCKPYLRPMSSMTEEEEKEYNTLLDNYGDENSSDVGFSIGDDYDWLNSHHFDYRGLIEKGLALEAPEGMYKIE